MIEAAVRIDAFPLREAFTISRGSRTEAQVVTLTLRDERGHQGHGECVPYPRYGETCEGVVALALEMVEAVKGEADPIAALQRHPAGAARNAVDCALWDLRAKASGRPVWGLLGLEGPKPLTTAYTLSLDAPDAMRARAEGVADRPLLKIKLGGDGDLERLRAVREGAPDATLIVDANEGWDADTYAAMAPRLVDLGVRMVEQPMPVGADGSLAEIERILPVCADESCHDRTTLAGLEGLYDMVNVKLDKTGGLTEAVATIAEARRRGLDVMVGCMVGTSLAMAPAFLAAQGADLVDLDGPLLLAEDRADPIAYEGSAMQPPPTLLWG